MTSAAVSVARTFGFARRTFPFFLCFRGDAGEWGDAIDLTEHGVDPDAGLASISPDGKYMFFFKPYDIYWVSTRLIERLRPPAGAR